MKIVLGTNLFKQYHRQDIAIESLRKLQNQFSEIELVNLQFPDENYEYEGFRTIPKLTRDSREINKEGKKRKPWMREMFDLLSEEDCDYFIFTNSDIIISDRYIKEVLKSTEYDCIPASRLAIEDIKSLEDPIIPIIYQIAGFDTYAVRTSWWKENKYLFPDYIYAEPSWDVHYVTLMFGYGKTKLSNKWPAPTFHIAHACEWEGWYPERAHNDLKFWQDHKEHGQIWNGWLFNYLFKRYPDKHYYQPLQGEEQLEQQYWSSMVEYIQKYHSIKKV